MHSGATFRVLVDGAAGPEFSGITAGPVFTSDGRVVYAASLGGDRRLVVGEEMRPVASVVTEIATSATGDGLAWVERNAEGRGERVVFGGVAGPVHQDAFQLRLSPDGRRFAHGVLKGDRSAVVVDGVIGREFGEIGDGSIIWSPDGERVAYVAEWDGAWVVVVDGEIHPRRGAGGEPAWEQDDVSGRVAFSPDGSSVAWIARAGRGCRLVVDGEPVGPVHPAPHAIDAAAFEAPCVRFSPDGRRVAFVAESHFNSMTRGEYSKWRVVVGDAPGAARGIPLGPVVFESASRLRYFELRQPGFSAEELWLVREDLSPEPGAAPSK